MDNPFILITGTFGMCAIIYAIASIIRHLVQLYYDKNPTKDPWWAKTLIVISIILYICALPATIIIGGIKNIEQKYQYKKELRRVNAVYTISRIDAYYKDGSLERQKDHIKTLIIDNLQEDDPQTWRKKIMEELEMDEDYLHGIR